MEKREKIKEELEKMSPFLAAQKEKSEGFDLPKHYFKSLPEDVFKKINTGQQIVENRDKNWHTDFIEYLQSLFQPKYAMAFASILLVLFVGIYSLNFENTEEDQSNAIASHILHEITDEVLQDYVTNNIDYFDETILEEELAENTNSATFEFNTENSDELIDELIDDLDIDDLDDLL